jgi:hypothetical protein
MIQPENDPFSTKQYHLDAPLSVVRLKGDTPSTLLEMSKINRVGHSLIANIVGMKSIL